MTGKGGKYCVAGFSHQRSCRNSSSSKNISMHKFPTDKKQRSAWTSFIRRHRRNWNPTTTSTLCSTHFLGADFNQRVGIDVPEVQGCSTGSIKRKKFLNPGAVPTVDDFEIACQTFPETATHVPTTTPHVPENSTKLRAKRRLLREVHSPQSNTKSAPPNSENEELCTEGRMDTDTLKENIPQEMPLETSKNSSNDVKKMLKCKLKSSLQKCSKYRTTIQRLQLQLKVARGNNVCGGASIEESKEEDEAHYKCSSSDGDNLDGHVPVDGTELDNYLAEADEMGEMGKQDDPDWETLECGSEETDDDDDDDADDSNDDIATDSRNRVR